MVALLKSGEYSSAELGDLFGVARSTVYRAVERGCSPETRGATNDGLNSLKRAVPVALILNWPPPVERYLFPWALSRKIAPLSGQPQHQPATADLSPQEVPLAAPRVFGRCASQCQNGDECSCTGTSSAL
jgi:hypothetical protein